MDATRRSRLAWAIALACVAMSVASLVLVLLDRGLFHGSDVGPVGNIAPPVTLGLLGALIASRRPSSPIGWLMLGGSVFVGLSVLAAFGAIHGLLHGVSPDAWPRWLGWMQFWLGSIALGVLILILLLFPNGKPPGPRWRWLVPTTCVVTPLWVFGQAVDPTPVTVVAGLPKIVPPISLHYFRGFNNSPAFFPILFLILASAIGMIVRMRGSTGEERQQLKWFAYAVGVSVATLFLAIPAFSLSAGLSNVMFAAAFSIGFSVLVPGAAALAILRYGLYEIDVVINKTVVYLTLAAAITAIYVAIVVGIGAAVGSKGSRLLSVVAAAIVAVAFQPIRERSGRFANRLVYGKRATPYEVLAGFSERLAGTYSLDDVLPRMAHVMGEGTGAEYAGIWLVEGRDLRLAASWPPEAREDALPLQDGDLPAPPAGERWFPVRHQGELLGALSVAMAPGEPLTSVEEKLFSDAAGQAGLVLRNVRLVSDLRSSRQRLVAAQDEERRRIERNIHDGAQQQLVALAVKHRLAETLIGKDDERLRQMLQELGSQTNEALEDLRDLARGIYPPLLADKGLPAALEAQARKSPVPTVVRTDGVGRLPKEVESAVYFSCLEALQNVAKYAQASSAQVRLQSLNGYLEFRVEDDGRGFDQASTGFGTGLRGMADRLDAVGGSLEIQAAPGSGTAVIGRVPAPASIEDSSSPLGN